MADQAISELNGGVPVAPVAGMLAPVEKDGQNFPVDLGDLIVKDAFKRAFSFSNNSNAGPWLRGDLSFAGDVTVQAVNVSSKVVNFDFTGCSALTDVYLSSTSDTIESVSVSGCTALLYLEIAGNMLPLAALDVSDCPLIEALYVGTTSLVTLDLTAQSSLKEFDCRGCPSLSIITLPMSAPITNFSASDCALPEAQIDAILAFLDSGLVENGYVELVGGTNGIPSAAGLASKAGLEGKGWEVLVNT